MALISCWASIYILPCRSSGICIVFPCVYGWLHKSSMRPTRSIGRRELTRDSLWLIYKIGITSCCMTMCRLLQQFVVSSSSPSRIRASAFEGILNRQNQWCRPLFDEINPYWEEHFTDSSPTPHHSTVQDSFWPLHFLSLYSEHCYLGN